MRPALNQVSLQIRHGETIGIAGRSGCGKSTLVKVLLRLVHPADGRVLLGGVPLAEVSRDDIARSIGYVGQTPFLFSGNVVENISYGNEQTAAMELVRAAQLAELHEEILQLPGSYAAQISERGQNLSGGQRQRLAIARILMKGAPILILDEATAPSITSASGASSKHGGYEHRPDDNYHRPSPVHAARLPADLRLR